MDKMPELKPGECGHRVWLDDKAKAHCDCELRAPSDEARLREALRKSAAKIKPGSCDCGHEEGDGRCYAHMVIADMERALSTPAADTVPEKGE